MSERKKITFQYFSNRTDRYGFTRNFKVYQSENCNPLRSYCMKRKREQSRKTGTEKRIYQNQAFGRRNWRHL